MCTRTHRLLPEDPVLHAAAGHATGVVEVLTRPLPHCTHYMAYVTFIICYIKYIYIYMCIYIYIYIHYIHICV